jgi:hypothetical protein
MRTTTFIRTSAVATIFALLVSAGTALADRDGKGGKGGGGDNGGGGGGGRSGNSDRGSSSRLSGGGDKSSSNRSSSKSSDSNKDSNKGNSNGPSTFRDNKGSDDSNKNVKDFQPPKFQGKQDQSGSPSKGSGDYKVLRPSDDKVRDFLKDNDNNKNNKDADRFKNRNPKDREVVDREYNKWQNTWNGDKGNKNDKGNKVGDNKGDNKNGRDNRDWSGKWKNSDRFTTADRIRNDWRGRKGNDFVFNDNWWNNKHRGNYWNFWGNYGRRYNNPYYWWSWANGPRLGSWFVFGGWPQPYYWDYGQGEYIYADNGAIYVNGRWYAPAPVFYQQTEQLIDQSPTLNAESAAKLDWMPLGVFAATPDGLNEPEITVQLATTKEGQIGGTAFNPKTGAAYNIQGTVDKKTQRAVWSYTNDQNKRIMMETSVYNLTQPEATGLVHYSPTDMRVVELVRLEQPEAGAANSSPSLPAPPVNQ